MKKCKNINSNKIFSFLAVRGFFNNMQNEKYIKKMYKAMTDEELDLNNPKTFNEKLQWLKIHNKNDIYTTMVDKYEVKNYIKSILGENYLIPTLGVYNSFDEIDFTKLPNQFVMKCTHDSGGIVIVKDKSKLDIKQAKKKINKSLKSNYYYLWREWPYKNVKPRIIIEKYMEDESKKELKDYKIFCFNGEPKIIMVDSGRFEKHVRNVYDTNWNKLDLSINFPTSDSLNIPKPKKLKQMLKLSEALSKDIPFIRTDFYIINNDIFFGELTFFPGSGFQKIEPKDWQLKLGNMINLNGSEKNEKNDKKNI